MLIGQARKIGDGMAKARSDETAEKSDDYQTISMNITRRWKRGLAVGCSHGNLADPKAIKAVLDFKKEWKPDRTLHLGDAYDLAAFRSGAGPVDLAIDTDEDLEAGTTFLTQLEPTDIWDGNHEDRIRKFARHPNAIIKKAAVACCNELDNLAKKFKTEIVPYDIDDGWKQFGDALFGHGYMFNEMAIRDHAELVGKCVIAHLHRVGQERARRRGGATGHCVGLLGEPSRMEYAKHQKSRTKWSKGWAFFEYCDTQSVIWLIEQTKSGEFRTPL